jgi:fructosamine-3-kinase
VEPSALVVDQLGPGRWSAVGGGDICDAWRLDAPHERPLFVKTLADAPEGFFGAEVKGLGLLRSSGEVLVPEVVAHSDEPGGAFLALEWIELGSPVAATDEALGRSLASMHLASLERFGGDGSPAYLGSVPIDSSPADSWHVLWAEHRLRPLARLGRDRSRLPAGLARRVELVADRVALLAGPDEPPARIHGDLWSGNVLVGARGEPWLIDPSAHGGHRETDLGMMRLFGGFSDRCFAAYQEVAPLADGWTDRVPLHQLVPLLVHVMLFGGAYETQLDRALTALGA